ncbi:MAG: acyl-CoA thioesterase, partial [Desulfuromonadaceae bacterium]
MNGKTVKESSVIMSQSMSFQDANNSGNVHGGVIMKLIDTAGGVAAIRHARCNAVTASIDRLDFYAPVFVGDFVTLKASVNYVGRTSMEVGVRVESENPLTGKIRHTSSAYLTYVALDSERRPNPLP